MKLKTIVEQYSKTADTSVPDWTLGCFKRRSIAFANGLTDTQTHVFWLQSRNITIDLRLPIEDEQVATKALNDYSDAELQALANYEGWYAESKWANEALSWSGGTAFQIHNRWPEPAQLRRVGDCMIEFSPESTYVEDWRLLSRNQGPLIGLRLIEEQNLSTDEITHKDGALIINGNWAGLVLGRSMPIEATEPNTQLRELIAANKEKPAFLEQAFNFETSVAKGDIEAGFSIAYSTSPDRVGKPLFSIDGFEWDQNNTELVQTFERDGTVFRRRFSIDTLETAFPFSDNTNFSQTAADWFEFEQDTLSRYLRVVD